jgi:hypothetical protein
MRQLQLFTTAELARMRDRTASRSYSPEAEEFRRNHERHRAWGLARRHAERLRRLREADLDSPAHTVTTAMADPRVTHPTWHPINPVSSSNSRIDQLFAPPGEPDLPVRTTSRVLPRARDRSTRPHLRRPARPVSKDQRGDGTATWSAAEETPTPGSRTISLIANALRGDRKANFACCAGRTS